MSKWHFPISAAKPELSRGQTITMLLLAISLQEKSFFVRNKKMEMIL